MREPLIIFLTIPSLMNWFNHFVLFLSFTVNDMLHLCEFIYIKL